MASYPVTVPVKMYNGRNKKKQWEFLNKLRIAKILEDTLNKISEESDRDIIKTHYELSNMTGISPDKVRDMLFAAGGGHTGITIIGKQCQNI